MLKSSVQVLVLICLVVALASSASVLRATAMKRNINAGLFDTPFFDETRKQELLSSLSDGIWSLAKDLEETMPNRMFPQASNDKRRLQDRACNEVIGRADKDEILQLATFLVTTLFPDEQQRQQILLLLSSATKYDVVGYKVCSSCAEVEGVKAGEAFLVDGERFGFASYCGDGKFWHNVTSSGLLLIPETPGMGEAVQGKLKGAIVGHFLRYLEGAVPSEVWPTGSILELLGTSQDPATQLFTLFATGYELITAVAASTAGAVSILPDYIGYGEGTEETKSFIVKDYYAASVVPLWYKSQAMVKSMIGPCTMRDNYVTLAGYSEGGYSAVAMAFAMDKLGITVLSVHPGGGPYKFARVFAFGLLHE